MGGSDSKLVFKSRVEQLLEKRVSANDHDFWSVLFTSQLAVEDIFSVVEPEDIRNLRKKQPQNLGTVIYKCIEQLYLFSLPENYQAEFTSARNSLNMLSRILPFVFSHDDDRFATALFFENSLLPEIVLPKPAPAPAQAAQGADAEKAAPAPAVQPVGEPKKKTLRFATIGDHPLQVPLAEAMITTLYNVLFIPGFNVPTAQLPIHKEEHELDAKRREPYHESMKPAYLWEGGLIVPDLVGSQEQVPHRMDTLRTLLSCFSGVLHQPADIGMRNEQKIIGFATRDKLPYTCTLLYSLLNIVFAYEPAGYLPYTTVLMADPKERMVEMALQTLMVLLNHKTRYDDDSSNYKIKTALSENGGNIKVQMSPIHKNVYLEHLKNLQKDDIEFLAKGFAKLFQNILDANNTYLPNSQKMITFFEELLVIFWKILDASAAFRKYVCGMFEFQKFLVPILFIMHTHCKEPSKFALVQLCSFILLLLSAQREFGVSLNKPFDIKSQIDLPIFTGNYADYLTLSLHKFISSDKGVIRPLFDCLLTVISNISPYTKSLSMVTSTKLISLFEAFASPKFLYTGEKHPLYVSLLLEVFNNLIQYQYEGNVHTVYTILRKKKIFQDLAKSPNLAEIKQVIEKRQEKLKEKNPAAVASVFIPTPEWVALWKRDLPLYTILTLLKALVPEVEKLCEKELATEEDVLVYLRNTTLVGLLPVPHTIVIRTFQSNLQIDTFLTTYLWGMVFLKNNRELPLFDTSSIKLFTINVV